MSAVYGVVQSEPDIVRVNDDIRHEMEAVQDQWDLTQFKRRSDYLCKLAAQPIWRTRFGPEVADGMLRRARQENGATVAVANRVAAQKGWNIVYRPWRPVNLDIGGSQRPG